MVIYGASGHGKVIASILKDVTLFFDDKEGLTTFLDKKVESYSDSCIDEEIIIAIGDNKIRKKVSERITHVFGTAIAPSSEIDSSVILSEGCQVVHGAIIQAASVIGRHTIINTGATVDHDTVLRDFCHIAPQAIVCGGVEVGEGTLIGAGAIVIPGVKIGKWCTIGAGSVVTIDIPDNSVAVGSPARVIKSND